MKVELVNGVGSQYPSHYLGTCCIQVDVGGSLSVELAEVQEVHVTVKGHRHRFIANSLSELLDQFLLRRQ